MALARTCGITGYWLRQSAAGRVSAFLQAQGCFPHACRCLTVVVVKIPSSSRWPRRWRLGRELCSVRRAIPGLLGLPVWREESSRPYVTCPPLSGSPGAWRTASLNRNGIDWFLGFQGHLEKVHLNLLSFVFLDCHGDVVFREAFMQDFFTLLL